MKKTTRTRNPKPVVPHPPFDVIAIGASAGGLHALTETLRSLPQDFPCSIVVVQHLSPRHKSVLPELLARTSNIKVKSGQHGEIMLRGWAYLAPPDEHLLVGPGKLQLAHSQLVHFSRPSVDLLFESVAGTYGSRCIGVILSGSGKDGATGLRAIKEAGGTTLVQSPADAEFPSMPEAAVQTGCVDYTLALRDIGETLTRLCCGTTA